MRGALPSSGKFSEKKKKKGGWVRGGEMETSVIISPDSKPSIFKLLEEYESSVSPPDPVGWDLPPPLFLVVMSLLKKSLGGRVLAWYA